MSKPKLNIFTNAFVNGSCENYYPKTFEWIFNSYPSNFNPVVYFDVMIICLSNDNYPGPKYGWLGESSEIIWQIVDYIKDNLPHFKQNYKKIFVNDKRIVEIDRDFFIYSPPASNMPWITECKIYNKTNVCSFITSFKNYTSGHKKRISLFKELKDTNTFKDHIYGKTYRNIKNKIDGLKDYMFSIAMENSVYPKYYTEKVTDCFATGTIPIYYGDRSICEDFDSEGIIFLEDLSDFNLLNEELYFSKIESVKNNFEKVKHLKTADDLIFEKIMELENGL